jgi:hypothetical protein
MDPLEKKLQANSTLHDAYEHFWHWFSGNADTFHAIVKEGNDIEEGFFNKLGPQLNAIKEDFWYVTGMYDDDTAELIFTADGELKQIAFIEDLVSLAPALPGWRFTALKPALDIKNVAIELDDFRFDSTNLSFYANVHSDYPDEIDITVVHHEYKAEQREPIVMGVYLFLDNYLGELDAATLLDNVNVIGKEEAEQELIPIEKLKDFLHWRQKEFRERYEGLRHDTEHDSYTGLEARLKNGGSLVATINKDLLHWDSKASHPWILIVKIPYEAGKDGMPDAATYELLDRLEDQIEDSLQPFEGYLNVGRQTGQGLREIFLACKDFRKPSRLLWELQQEYKGRLEMDFEIYKDKYWICLERFGV